MNDQAFAKISLSGEALLRRLFELEAFRVCPPLDTNSFLRFSEGRGKKVTPDLLEQFEKKELLRPFFRARFPVAEPEMSELDTLEDGSATSDGETRTGRVRKSYIWPDVTYHDLGAWLEEGYLYSPEDQAFQEWSAFRDVNGRQARGSYYSPFQVYTLRFQLNMTGQLLNAAWIVDYEDQDFEQLQENLKKWAAARVADQSPSINPRYDAVVLAQAISSRYFPQACTDLRTVSTPGLWDWHAYVRKWKADEVVASLGLTSREVKRLFEIVDTAIFFADPLEDWDDLLIFVERSRKEKLKGDAQYGQTLRHMRDMFGLLYKDLTGEEIEPRKGCLAERYVLDDSSRFARKGKDRRVKADRDVELLEFVTNRYGLNPRPALVLFVEGLGEETIFPLLAERFFGVSLSTCGIEVRNLYGVTGFTGKRRDPYGALEKVIEELHLVQTVAFVVLDNESGGVHKLRKKLSTAPSKYYPGRTIIRREFVHIWKQSIELDNFTTEEIATALSVISEERYRFSAAEVARAAAGFGRKGDPISRLYSEKVEYDLPKPKCLKLLAEEIPLEEGVTTRPILVLLNEVLEIAALNHKPTFVDLWFENQESGYLGHPVEGDDRMTERFQRLSQIQEHLAANVYGDERTP